MGEQARSRPTALITPAMRAVLGVVVDWRVSYPVAASDIRRWAIAVHHPGRAPREYLDEEFARSTRGGFAAPEEFNPFAWAVAERMVPAIEPGPRDPDRLEKAAGIAGAGLVHQVNGGTEAQYGEPIRVGDVIRSETRIIDYRERSGRLGPMLITVSRASWTNQRGESVRTESTTSIRY